MKFRVLAHAYGWILLMAALLLLKTVAPDFPLTRNFSLVFTVGLSTALLIGVFVRNEKYLINISMDGEDVTLTYLTIFLRRKQRVVLMNSITKINLKKKIFLMRFFDSITISTRWDDVGFHIISFEAKKAVEHFAITYSLNKSKVAANGAKDVVTT